MQPKLSAKHINRLKIQGFTSCSSQELTQLRFGIRFAYATCAIIAALGIYFGSIPVLGILVVLAMLGVVLPNHPFDYIYNHGLRLLLHRPALPPRTAQVKFACGIAVIWLAVTILLFWSGFTLIGTIWGSILVLIATLVSTTDICIPSMIYNLITNKTIGPVK